MIKSPYDEDAKKFLRGLAIVVVIVIVFVRLIFG